MFSIFSSDDDAQTKTDWQQYEAERLEAVHSLKTYDRISLFVGQCITGAIFGIAMVKVFEHTEDCARDLLNRDGDSR